MLEIEIGGELIVWPLNEATRNTLKMYYDSANIETYRLQRDIRDKEIIKREFGSFFYKPKSWFRPLLSDLFRTALQTASERDKAYLEDLQLVIKAMKAQSAPDEFSVEERISILNTFSDPENYRLASDLIQQNFGIPPANPDDSYASDSDESSDSTSGWENDGDPDSDESDTEECNYSR